MSITNGTLEVAEGEEAATEKSALRRTIEMVKDYILGLPQPHGDRLSEHATHTQHEDVEDDEADVAKPSKKTLATGVEALKSSIPPIDPKIPSRLRSTIPPINFGAVVEKTIYRSGYPDVENFSFLKSLGLKTILTLVPEPISPEYRKFMAEHGIQHLQVPIPANKGQVKISACEMTRALEIVLDRRNHPMLIHCNKGKHRTGCVVGCFRRVQGSESEQVFDEYHAYADPKARLLDEAFIEQFDENTVLWMARRYGWIPPVEPPSPVSTLNSSSLNSTASLGGVSLNEA